VGDDHGLDRRALNGAEQALEIAFGPGARLTPAQERAGDGVLGAQGIGQIRHIGGRQGQGWHGLGGHRFLLHSVG